MFLIGFMEIVVYLLMLLVLILGLLLIGFVSQQALVNSMSKTRKYTEPTPKLDFDKAMIDDLTGYIYYFVYFHGHKYIGEEQFAASPITITSDKQLMTYATHGLNRRSIRQTIIRDSKTVHVLKHTNDNQRCRTEIID